MAEERAVRGLIVSSLLLGSLCVGGCRGGQPDKATKQRDAVVQQLDLLKARLTYLPDETGSARGTAHVRIPAQRAATIRSLIAIVRNKKPDRKYLWYRGPHHRAIALLGELRATEAIPCLLKELMYAPEGVEGDETLPSEYYYVAAPALVKIGSPAINRLVLEIRNSKDIKRRNLAAWIIMEIDGKQQALHRFTILIKKGGGAKANYSTAKKHLETRKPFFESPTWPDFPADIADIEGTVLSVKEWTADKKVYLYSAKVKVTRVRRVPAWSKLGPGKVIAVDREIGEELKQLVAGRTLRFQLIQSLGYRQDEFRLLSAKELQEAQKPEK